MKIYGLRKRITQDYFENTYTEYRDDGTIVQTGTEDFSLERWHKQVKYYQIAVWNGDYYPSGNKRWSIDGYYFTNGTPKQLKRILQARWLAGSDTLIDLDRIRVVKC